MHATFALVLVLIAIACCGCRTVPTQPTTERRWALVVHGGAGTIDKETPPDQQKQYKDGLAAALKAGQAVLDGGGSAVDAVEATVRVMEDNELFNAGKGAVYTAEGTHELDASIMDGRTLACGAVAGVKTVKNPIGLARLVMDKSKHVLFAADGAEQFADEMGVPRVDNHYFDTQKRYDELQHKLEALRKNPTATYKNKGTVGAVALDTSGHLAAATSTGGMTAKRFGRVGDSPIVGAGTYADDRTVAVSCTGVGEEYIRHAIAYDVSARIAYLHESVTAATDHVIYLTLKPDDGGLIAVDTRGEIAMPYNTRGMYRGCCDYAGRFETHLFKD